MMNKQLLATFLLFGTISFFSIAQAQPSCTNSTKGKQLSNARLLQHLENVRFSLQKHIKTMHDNFEEGMMYSKLPEETEEAAEMTLFFNLTEDFYTSSIVLQQKVSELVNPAFNFICNNIRTLDLDEISHHLHPYMSSTIDRNTTRQLQTLFQSLYTKHYKIHRNSNPNIELTQIPVDELFEQCLQFIIGTNDLFIYESKVLLQQLDAKIKELK
jgi:hypothetical protein